MVDHVPKSEWLQYLVWETKKNGCEWRKGHLGAQGGENNSSIKDMLSLRYFSGFQVGLG